MTHDGFPSAWTSVKIDWTSPESDHYGSSMDAMSIGWTVAAVITGGLFSAWGVFVKGPLGSLCLAASFLPLAIMALVSIPRLVGAATKLALSATVGVPTLALMAIGVVGAWQSTASARTGGPSSGKSGGDASRQFSQNVTSYNQSGGITAGTVNVGPQRLTFTSQLGNDLLTHMPLKKKVILTGIGGNSDQAVAIEITNFLRQNGYEVERNATGVMSPPPDQKITLGDTPDSYNLTIAPSAN